MSNVNHPAHYRVGRYEAIDIIEERGWGEGFNRGNAIKYLLRAGTKDPNKEIEDLEKARWYVEREIARLRANNSSSWLSFKEINKILTRKEEEDRIWENGVEIK